MFQVSSQLVDISKKSTSKEDQVRLPIPMAEPDTLISAAELEDATQILEEIRRPRSGETEHMSVMLYNSTEVSVERDQVEYINT